MAQTDLDNYKDNEREAKEAAETLEPYGQNIVDAEAKAAADAAGVRRASQIDYEEALIAYTDRDDIESLAAYNARTYPDTFADANYVRAEAGSGSAAEPSDS